MIVSSLHLRETFFYLLKIFLLTAIYYLTAKLGLAFDAVSGFATLFWLPTGISLVVVFLGGYRMLPGVFLGAFIANFTSGAPYFIANGIAIGNTLEAFVGAYLLKTFMDFQPSLERLRDALGLILIAGCLSTAISATIGVTSLFLGGLLTSSYNVTWTAWWIGDVISNLIVAPFLFVWSQVRVMRVSPARVIEGLFLAGGVLFIGDFVFAGTFRFAGSSTPLTYLIFPPLIWLALRFGPKETMTATLFLSLIAVWGAVQGHGPFATESVSQSLLLMQSFMVVVAVTSLLLSSVVAERRGLEKRKDDFVSFASHELKTPLTSIKLFTNMLEREFPGRSKTSVKARRYLTQLDLQVNKLIRLVNDMLDLPKVQQGKLEFRKEHFSLKALITEVVDSLQQSAEQQIVLGRRNAQLQIYADRERIGQVLTNLLSNAIKYSPPGAKIIISTRLMKDKAVVSVRDFGMGIPKEQQKQIFDRFYRVNSNAMQSTPGLGIGLYLSSMIVKYHGGTISVKSRERRGSTFSFTLPLSDQG